MNYTTPTSGEDMTERGQRSNQWAGWVFVSGVMLFFLCMVLSMMGAAGHARLIYDWARLTGAICVVIQVVCVIRVLPDPFSIVMTLLAGVEIFIWFYLTYKDLSPFDFSMIL
jgi:hypothetical protein